MDFDGHCKEIEANYRELEARLAEPETLSNQKLYSDLARRHSELGRIVQKWQEFVSARTQICEAAEMTKDADPEMAQMAEEELAEAEAKLPQLEQELQLLLLPSDPMDAKNIVMEIRAGTGGEEAALFAGNLFRLILRYAETQNWKTEILSQNATELGGFKEVIFSVAGERVYSQLKFESGTHRVQRVPATETQGRVHTSAITVAVMPEADEVDVQIRNEDLKIDVYRSSGPGGQSVNTTDSAVRITHLPTSLVVSIQDEKSQIKNKAKAMKVLRSRLLELKIQKQQQELASKRKQQVGTGDRSQRIRTYNFPQNRCTDHRIGLTLYKLDQIMEGRLDLLVEPLILNEQKEKLEYASEQNIEGS